MAGCKPDKLMRQALLLELQQEDTLTDGQKVRRMRRVAAALVNKALDGDVPAIKEIADRVDGKVAQQQILSGDAENPLVPEVSDLDLARRIAFILASAEKLKG